MTSIFCLLDEEKKLVEELNELRTELVELKRLRLLDEGLAWTIDFKAIGATSDKMRSAAVQREMNKFPNTYAQKKAEFENKEEELRTLRHLIQTMRIFEIMEIEDKDVQGKDKDGSAEFITETAKPSK